MTEIDVIAPWQERVAELEAEVKEIQRTMDTVLRQYDAMHNRALKAEQKCQHFEAIYGPSPRHGGNAMSSDDVLRYLKITRYEDDGKGGCTVDVLLAQEEVSLLLSEGDVGDRMVFEVVEMTEAEHDALPEFMGW